MCCLGLYGRIDGRCDGDLNVSLLGRETDVWVDRAVVARRSHRRLSTATKEQTTTNNETMGKKKPFIDRKKASTYHLLHRSQRDVAGEVLEEGDLSRAGMVLWPAPGNNVETDKAVLRTSKKMEEWREKIAKAGLLDEGPDKYLKPITGSGVFLDASGKVGTNSNAVTVASGQSSRLEEETLMEVQRQFDSIPLSAEYMDDDIAAALFSDDFEAGDFEELNDDFVLQAAEEPDDEGEGFDFDEHIRRLMEKAKAERDASKAVYFGDDNFFSNAKPLHELDEEDSWEATPGVVPALAPDEERALCEKFEETLAEYDSDEVGDCPEEEIYGTRPLEGDAQVDAALDEFLTEKKDEIFMQGKRHYLSNDKGGSGYAALVGTHMVPAKELDRFVVDGGPPETVDEILEEANQALKSPAQAPPPEEIFIDGQSYFSERARNPWDCETILTTYSNLDNNPVTIDASRRRRRKKKVAPHEEEEPVQQIQLSNKTGLPLGVLPSRPVADQADDTFVSVNRGEARKKNESKEEKKARKIAVKQEKQLARIQKKVTREVFREEFEKRAVDVGADDIAGKTVFRF